MASIAQQTLKSQDERRERNQARARARAILLADELLENKAPDLVAKRPGASLSRNDCESIVISLRDRVEGTYYIDARKHLRERLKYLREITGGQVVLPPPATRIKRDKSPFAGDAFYLSAQLEILLQQFFEDLKHGIDFDPDVARFDSLVKRFKGQEPEAVIARRKQTLAIGRIVFSAIVNGGMLHRNLYLQLPKMLSNDLQAHGHHAWVSFPLQRPDPRSDEADLYDPNDPDQPVRRWFLDPVTLGLVARWRLDQSIDDCRMAAEQVKAADALKAYLSYLSAQVRKDSDRREAPRLTTRSLFDAAGARLSLYLPQILVRFLKSITEGSSMSERSWWRYTHDLQVQYTPQNQDEAELGQAAIDASKIDERFAGNEARFFDFQEMLIKLLNQCLSDPARSGAMADNHVAAKAIQEALDARESDMAPILNAWYRWVLWKLTRASKAQGRIESISAKRYTSRLGSALIEIGAEMAVEGTSTSDWEAFYQDVLDALKSDKDRAKAIGTLLQFHEFMMASFDVPPVTIEGQSGSGSRPRISLVNDKDYERLMKALDNNGKPSHRHRMLRLIAMLMYRVGLRPREIIGLEYRLIQGVSKQSLKAGTAYPVLYLRVTSQEDLKTSSAVRQIPLSWFLTPAELAELNEHLAKRLDAHREKDQQSMLILSTARNNNRPLNQGESLGTLAHLLRSITGDPSVVAYSLRHSCFSHLFAALLSRDGNHDCLGGQLLRNGHLPREIAYSISNLAGHLDPVITLQFYIHMQDLVAHKMLSRQQADVSLAVWSTLEGVSSTSIEQRRRRQRLARKQKKEADGNGVDGRKTLLWQDNARQLIRKLKCPEPKMRQGKDVPIPELEFPERSLLDLDMDDINALMLSGQRRYSHQARAEFFDLPAKQIASFLSQSLSLASIVSVSYSGRQQFRNLRVKTHERIPEMFRRPQPGISGPAPPNTRAERAEATRIYKLLGSRAAALGFESEAVQSQILRPVQDLLAAQSRSESVVRATSPEQFTDFISTLRALRIKQERIEIEVESLPRTESVDTVEWIRHLRKLASARKLPAANGHEILSRRSRKYPQFGIVKIRVLELATAEPGELKREARGRAGVRAGAGWRVGCFYACAALGALMHLPTDFSSVDK